MKYSTLLVHIPKDVHNRLKKRCIDVKMTQREVIRRLIALYAHGDIDDDDLFQARDEQSKLLNGKIRGIANASHYLGVSVSAVKRMIREGRLKPIRSPPIHGGLLFKESELNKLKEK